MASRLVEGVRLPISLGGPAAVEFCNTRAAWASPTPKEYLQTYEHVVRWVEVNDLLAPGTATPLLRLADEHPAHAARMVPRAVALREALYTVFVGPRELLTGEVVGTDRAGSFALVAREAERALARLRLVPAVDAPARWELGNSSSDDRSRLDLPVLAVARAAADLLTTPAGGTVSACPMPDCGWVFGNPHGRRRWCSMAMCGNRTKVRRHAASARRSRADA